MTRTIKALCGALSLHASLAWAHEGHGVSGVHAHAAEAILVAIVVVAIVLVARRGR